MDSEIRWYVQDYVIYLKLPDSIDDTETIDQLNYGLVELLDKGEQPIHIIFDMLDYKTQFTKLNQVGNMDSMSKLLKHPSIGWSIIITENSLLKFTSAVVTNLFKTKFKSCTSLEEANAILSRLDARLTDIDELILNNP